VVRGILQMILELIWREGKRNVYVIIGSMFLVIIDSWKWSFNNLIGLVIAVYCIRNMSYWVSIICRVWCNNMEEFQVLIDLDVISVSIKTMSKMILILITIWSKIWNLAILMIFWRLQNCWEQGMVFIFS